MLVLGGSMLAGIGCTPGWNWKCAYQAAWRKCGRHLKGNMPRSCVLSAAREAARRQHRRSLSSVPTALDESGAAPDLILVDFSVNDARESQDWTVDIGKEAAAAALTRGDRVFAATEAFLRFALRKGSSALLVVESRDYEPESDAHRAAASPMACPSPTATASCPPSLTLSRGARPIVR